MTALAQPRPRESTPAISAEELAAAWEVLAEGTGMTGPELRAEADRLNTEDPGRHKRGRRINHA